MNNITPGDKVRILSNLEHKNMVGKIGIVTDVHDTHMGFMLVWMIIDNEKWMFFSDELEKVEE